MPLVAETAEARAILADDMSLKRADPIVHDRMASRRSGRDGREPLVAREAHASSPPLQRWVFLHTVWR